MTTVVMKEFELFCQFQNPQKPTYLHQQAVDSLRASHFHSGLCRETFGSALDIVLAIETVSAKQQHSYCSKQAVQHTTISGGLFFQDVPGLSTLKLSPA